MNDTHRVRVLGVPMDLGAAHRGVDMGPFSVRVAGLIPGATQLGYQVEDAGNLPVLLHEQLDVGDPKQRYLRQIVDVCERLATEVARSAADHVVSIVIGGDHSVAMGSLAGVAKAYRGHELGLGLLWVDAHADFNTPETSGSGNIHGMPLSSTLGVGSPPLTTIGGFEGKFNPERVVHLGGRDFDGRERQLLRDSGITVYTMRDIDERGLPTVMCEALERLTDGTAGIAASVDVDGFDPSWSPGVGTPVQGGLTYREAHLVMEMLADTRQLRHIDLVEINPLLDTGNTTSERGVELVLSALGKQIL